MYIKRFLKEKIKDSQRCKMSTEYIIHTRLFFCGFVSYNLRSPMSIIIMAKVYISLEKKRASVGGGGGIQRSVTLHHSLCLRLSARIYITAHHIINAADYRWLQKSTLLFAACIAMGCYCCRVALACSRPPYTRWNYKGRK